MKKTDKSSEEAKRTGKKRNGRNILFYEQRKLIMEKFDNVKFYIFSEMKYDKPIEKCIYWLGASLVTSLVSVRVRNISLHH